MASDATHPQASTSSRSSPVVNGNSELYINGHGALAAPQASHNAQSSAPITSAPKKSKGKKAADPNETGKLLAAKINQLELDAAGEKDQEAEIEREVKKATRDLAGLLNGIEAPLSRIETVQKRYSELLADMKRLERDYGKSKKRADLLQKEKDHGRSELSKTVVVKDKLEKLCRELQRENKKIKEEQKKLEESEKRSRESLTKRLDGMVTLVHEVVQQKENPANQRLHMETDELFKQKFKTILDQYELREIHFYSLMRTKECEVQYQLARYERERKLAENEANRSRTLTTQVSTFSQTETELRSQLNIYVEKFKQVEDTLNNSNDLFLTFRKEMEEMSKKTKRLEKENLNLTRKHDLTNRNILEMAEERTRVNKEMETLRKKNNTLESVIRRMQDQGRGAPVAGIEGDEEGTESDYEEDEYDEEDGSEEVEFDDDTEEEALQARMCAPSFGPIPPPPPPVQTKVNGTRNGEANGVAPH